MKTRRIPPILVLALSSAITSLDFTIIFLAIPSIQRDLGAGVADTQWVAAVYAVAYGGFLLLGGRLADTYGRRRCFAAGLIGFGVASVAGALAPSLAVLLISRVGQGLSAAVLFPATLALLHRSYPEDGEKRRALSIWAAAGSGGLIAGTILGGVLTDLAGWRGVMWVNVPLVLIGLALGMRSLAATRDRTEGHIGAASWGTSFLAAVIVASVCLLAVRAQTWGVGEPTWIVLAVILVAAVATRFLLRRPGASLVSQHVAADRNLRSAVLLGAAFMGAFGTVYFLLSLDLQSVRDIPPILTGIALIPGSLGGIVGSFLAGRLLNSHSPRAVVSGAMIIGGVGLAMIAATMSLPLPLMLVSLGFASTVQGIAYAAIFALAGHTIVAEEQGVATGVVSTGQQIGSAIGLAVATLCIELGATGAASGMRSGIVLALGIAAAVVLSSGALTASRLGSTRGKRRAESS